MRARPALAIRNCCALASALLFALTAAHAAFGESVDSSLARIVKAYPDQLSAVEGGTLIWHDGTRMAGDDGKGAKSFADWLEKPDIEDMVRQAYPAGAEAFAPAPNFDPGRARNRAFFDKMYGDCRKGSVTPHLKSIVWLPKKAGQRLAITGINGVDAKLMAISAELDELPASFDRYLFPAAGTYVCRVIAGTSRSSAHGYGIAIDIATDDSDYWRWAEAAADGSHPYRNRIPIEIVRIFEKHGFIWGGRWSHYDTMHFEYRPELLPAGG